MVDTTKDVWTNPGVSDEVRNWQGTSQPRLQQLNNARLEGALPDVGKPRRPEGSTLRGGDWDPGLDPSPKAPASRLSVREW